MNAALDYRARRRMQRSWTATARVLAEYTFYVALFGYTGLLLLNAIEAAVK